MLSLGFLLLSQGLWAQEPRSKEERIRSLKIAYITEELQLTSEQSQQFWPIYNEWQAALKNLRKKIKPLRNIDDMSDAELENMLEQQLQAEEERARLNRTYSESLRKVISIRQLVGLVRAERQFKRELLKRAREARGGGRGRR